MNFHPLRALAVAAIALTPLVAATVPAHADDAMTATETTAASDTTTTTGPAPYEGTTTTTTVDPTATTDTTATTPTPDTTAATTPTTDTTATTDTTPTTAPPDTTPTTTPAVVPVAVPPADPPSAGGTGSGGTAAGTGSGSGAATNASTTATTAPRVQRLFEAITPQELLPGSASSKDPIQALVATVRVPDNVRDSFGAAVRAGSSLSAKVQNAFDPRNADGSWGIGSAAPRFAPWIVLLVVAWLVRMVAASVLADRTAGPRRRRWTLL